MTLAGTMMACSGMFLCAYVIERSKQEIRYKRENQVKSKSYWVQPGGQKIRDQVFRSFIGVSDDNKLIRSIRIPPEDHKIDMTLWIAVVSATLGFVVQFVGLRAMHSSITLAQLGSTLIMAIIRASLRTQRMIEKTDILLKDSTYESIRKYAQGYELEILAMHLENIKGMHFSGTRRGRLSEGTLGNYNHAT